LEPNDVDDFYQGGDDSAWSEMQGLETVNVYLLEYLRSPVSEGSSVNNLSHIIRTVDARKDGVPNESIIGCFETERDVFGANNLPKTYSSLLKKLDVPDLSSACRHMWHYVCGHLPQEVFNDHDEGDTCPVCGNSRFHKVRGKLSRYLSFIIWS
jgi:hypothetical protein